MQDAIIAQKGTKRLNFLLGLFFVLGAIFLFRLLDRQVFHKEQFEAQAQKQYYTKIDQPAERGNIYIKDRDSQNLFDSKKTGLFSIATDLELYNVTAIPRHIKDKKETAEKLAGPLGEDENKIFEAINQDKWYIPPLKKRISKEEADKVANEKLAGIYLEKQYSRFYPEGEFLSDVLGFVDFEGKGRYGLEEYYDGLLRGEGGTLKGLKDNLGHVIKVEESAPGKNGTSIVLTIDRSIQYVAEKKLKEGIERYKADGGTIIIMDPKTGGVLAMASSPSYDPNKFNEVPKESQNIFLNPASSLNWEPGSIFKPVVAAAAIDDKKVEPDSKPERGFSNMVVVDGYEIHNALDKPFGFETVTEILENSDNIGMIWVADKIGNEIMANYIKKFGFSEKSGIDLAGEASGQLGSPRTWHDVNRATISFGQGISATPIQVISAYSVLANGGKMVKPHLVDEVIDPNQTKKKVEPSEPKQVISEESTKKMIEMLVSVVEKGHGKKAQVEGYRVAGKTGTAQIPKPDGGYEESQHIGSFAGFAPADDPKFVMLVKFDRPQNVEWAESSAAPIFGEIADWLMNSYWKLPK